MNILRLAKCSLVMLGGMSPKFGISLPEIRVPCLNLLLKGVYDSSKLLRMRQMDRAKLNIDRGALALAAVLTGVKESTALVQLEWGS